MYLAQVESHILQKKAKEIARLLKLKYEYRIVGYGELETSLSSLNTNSKNG